MANTGRFRAEPVDEFNLRDSIWTHRYLMCSDPRKTKAMNIDLQTTSKVILKSLIFPSPYAIFKSCSSVEEGKEKLYWNFSPVGIKIGFQTLWSIIQAWFCRKFTPEKRSLQYQNKCLKKCLKFFLLGKKQKHKIPYIQLAIFSFSFFRHTIYQQCSTLVADRKKHTSFRTER